MQAQTFVQEGLVFKHGLTFNYSVSKILLPDKNQSTSATATAVVEEYDRFCMPVIQEICPYRFCPAQTRN